MISDLWYKNAVIYCLSVGTYMDADGDGTGDFKGLMRRLDYLHGLGAAGLTDCRSPLIPPARIAPATTRRDELGLGRGVTGLGQQVAEIDHHLRVDVLAGRRVEDLLLGSDRDGDLAVVMHGDRADRVEQRRHRVPLDVVAGGVLEDLAQRVAVMVVKVL